MEPTPTYTRLLPVSAMFLVGAAAFGFVIDLVFVIFSEDVGMTIMGIFWLFPFALMIAFIQDFAFQIRQGKVAFFTNQSPQQLRVTNFFILAIAVLLVVIALAVRWVDGGTEIRWWGYLLLMGISYFATWCIRFFRKHPIHLQ